MNKILRTALLITLLLSISVTLVYAQTSEPRGEVHGVVYEDVNGDGVCVNTGVNGEDPVANIDLEFVSSDEATVVPLYTGDDGSYGLVAAGLSVWRVTVKPDPSIWTVTSENPLYATVAEDTGLVQTDINFCIQKGGNAVIILPEDAIIVLPESGGTLTNQMPVWLMSIIAVGAGLIMVGLGIEARKRLIQVRN